jgi:hypothetical protein
MATAPPSALAGAVAPAVMMAESASAPTAAVILFMEIPPSLNRTSATDWNSKAVKVGNNAALPNLRPNSLPIRQEWRFTRAIMILAVAHEAKFVRLIDEGG